MTNAMIPTDLVPIPHSQTFHEEIDKWMKVYIDLADQEEPPHVFLYPTQHAPQNTPQ